jgi:hypothetical protein
MNASSESNKGGQKNNSKTNQTNNSSFEHMSGKGSGAGSQNIGSISRST